MRNLRIAALLAALIAPATTATAAPFVFSGTTAGGPTWNRPLEDLADLSNIGTAVPFDVFGFMIDTTTTVSFVSVPTTLDFDNFLLLYLGSFDAAMPLVNAVIASDDLSGVGVDAGFTIDLLAGTRYFLVTTGFENQDFGTFENTITPREGSVVEAVPEPATLSMLTLGMAGLGARRWRRRAA